VQVQPYLIFEGRCEEAIEFYKKALGAKVEMLMREGGRVQMPLGATIFGMVADRFGVSWMVIVPAKS
jgi:uncharacterized glyoxalase superfamily protein PhnB